MRTVKLTIGYDGTDFCGSQAQPGSRTVEGVLYPIIQQLYSEDIRLIFSGRTDAGVHASGQVVSFEHRPGIPMSRLVNVLNRALPFDIRVNSAEILEGRFDARRNATSRTYHYFFTSEILPVTMSRYVSFCTVTPNIEVFEKYRNLILGQNDFVNFRKVGSNERTTVRSVFEFELELIETQNWDGTLVKLWRVVLTANAFLFRMVRNLVGVLLALWQNTMNLSHVIEMLRGIDGRSFPFTVADPRGLHLVKVRY